MSLSSALEDLKKRYQNWVIGSNSSQEKNTGYDYIQGDVFISHTLGEDDWYRVISVMQQSIKVERIKDGFWYFETPGLINNHIGKKRLCSICGRK